MMTGRKRIEMELNKPAVFELQFDIPLQGQSKQGNYHLYGLKDKNNNEYSFFAA